jgi:exosortase/archaeosortase family protein
MTSSQSSFLGRPSFDTRPLLSALWLLPVAWLWFILINHLRVEWTLNPQYSYGWAVPFLCVYLLYRRLGGNAEAQSGTTGHSTEHSTFNIQQSTPSEPKAAFRCFSVSGFQAFGPKISAFCFLLSAFAVCYFPLRLVQEANPDWRLVSWTLALLTIAITMLVLGRTEILKAEMLKRRTREDKGQREGAEPSTFNLQPSTLVFPLCFFLTAVPWFRGFEAWVIQSLTRANVATAIELLGVVGVPAVQHGNVMEVATGLVGVDDACSGIRSFQACLMIALFLGELYRLSVVRRLSLCLAGFALSFLFNVARTTLLTGVAAAKGVPAIAQWHDPAGVTILVGCFAGLWLVGVRLAKSEYTGRRGRGPQLSTFNLQPSTFGFRPSAFPWLPLALLIWLVLVEAGVGLWYRAHESPRTASAPWNVGWPKGNPTLEQVPMLEQTQRILRFDDAASLTWQGEDGSRWQGIYFRWKPGHIWRGVLGDHNPAICLPASGRVVHSVAPASFNADSRMPLKFLRYEFEEPTKRLYVYFGIWEEGARQQTLPVASVTAWDRLRAVAEGRRNRGMQSFELAVWGINDKVEADRQARQQLQQLIVTGTEKPKT